MRRARELDADGQLGAARAVCGEILRAEPHNLDALHLAGVLCARMRDLPEAAALFERIIDRDPTNAAAHCDHGTAQLELGNLAGALVSFDRAIALKPGYAVALGNRGNALHAMGRWSAALASLDAAIAARPDFAVAWLNRGNVLRKLDRGDAALASFDTALRLDAALAEAWCHRGIVLRELLRLPEALASHTRAIELRGDYAEGYLNRGNVQRDLGLLPEALADFRRAAVLEPGLAEAHFNTALALLAAGDFAHGWAEYEWRWRQAGIACGVARHAGIPRWLGESSLDGRVLLVSCEQGLGDTLQFARYAPLLTARGAQVVLEVQPPLKRLLAAVPGIGRVHAMGDALPALDAHCPMMSLPLAFHTSLSDVPPPLPLRADPARLSRWRGRLGERARPRIGLVWSGNARHAEDRQRSVPLADFLPALRTDCDYVSLQKSVSEDDRRRLRDHPGIAVLADELDFDETAAVCECLDLIISVDTSVAHLAASLGRRTWILLPFSADWRWMTARTDSPWYPGVTLYRQATPGDWPSLLQRAGADCASLF